MNACMHSLIALIPLLCGMRASETIRRHQHKRDQDADPPPPLVLKANFLRVIQIPKTLRSGWDNRKGKCLSDLVVFRCHLLIRMWLPSVWFGCLFQIEERLREGRLTRRFAPLYLRNKTQFIPNFHLPTLFLVHFGVQWKLINFQVQWRPDAKCWKQLLNYPFIPVQISQGLNQTIVSMFEI